MPTLTNRLDALERQASPSDDLTVFIISFVRPGPDGPIGDEPVAYLGGDDESWNREPGETLDELKARARREVTRSNVGIAVLRECYEPEEMHHAHA